MSGSSKRLISKTSTVYIALGVALITLMTIVGASAFLRATDIIVEGTSMYSIEEIVEASGVSIGDNLLFINSQNVAQDIRAALPFVNIAQVSRVLPDTVLIEITESEAIARIAYHGDTLVVDSTARVLMKNPDSVAGLIEVRGVDIDDAVVGNIIRPIFGSEMKLQYMQDVLDAFEREGIESDVSYLDVSNIVNVHFGYMDKYRVILGGSTNLRQSNLRHNLSRLPDAVTQIEARFPTTSGDINMSDANSEPRFIPN